MSQQELFEVAQFLIEILEIEIKEEMVDPTEPIILINALIKLFPDKAEVWGSIQQKMNMEEQWNAIIEFIEINILEEREIPIQGLGIEEILQLYELVADYTEQKMQHEQGLTKQEPHLQKKQKGKDKKEKKGNNKSGEKQNKKQSNSKSVHIDTKNIIKNMPSANQSQLNPQKKKNQQPSKQIIKKQPLKQKIKKQSKSKPLISSQYKTKNNQEYSKRQSAQKKSISKEKIKASKSLKQAQTLQNQLIKKITTTMEKPLHDKNKKSSIMMKDPKSTQLVKKAKRQFQYFLKDYKRQGRLKHKFNAKLQERQQAKKKGLVDEYYLKVLKKKQKNIEEMVINEKLKYFMSLRDKKVAFITQIHKLTQKLQRQRQVQWEKHQRQLLQQQKQKSNNLFSKNMELLKQTYKRNKEKNQLQRYNERKICDEMEECMKKKKLEELGEIRMLWEQQNFKLNNIMGDQVKMKQKLIKLYQKHCP